MIDNDEGDWDVERVQHGRAPVGDPMLERALEQVFTQPGATIIVKGVHRKVGGQAIVLIMNVDGATRVINNLHNTDPQLADALKIARDGGLDRPPPGVM